MNQKYKVELSEEQRQTLEKITSSGTYTSRKIKHAQILLKSDQKIGWGYEQIMAAYDVTAVTIVKVRKTFVGQGLEAALQRKKPNREYKHVLDGEAEAHLVALVCGKPPQGNDRWTLRLLKKRMVELTYADAVSHETIRTTLKKMSLSLG